MQNENQIVSLTNLMRYFGMSVKFSSRRPSFLHSFIGRNDHGQLGTGDIITYPTPVVIYVYVYTFICLYTYIIHIHTYLHIHNTYLYIYIWMSSGRNDHGQLETGDVITYLTPVVLHIYTYVYRYIYRYISFLSVK
jgi:hypothetical protein